MRPSYSKPRGCDTDRVPDVLADRTTWLTYCHTNYIANQFSCQTEYVRDLVTVSTPVHVGIHVRRTLPDSI